MRVFSERWPIWGAPFRSATNSFLFNSLTSGELCSERGGLSTYLPGKGGEVVCVLGGVHFWKKIGHGKCILVVVGDSDFLWKI